MTTIDNLLTSIINYSSPPIEEQISPRDSKVLRSLALSATNQQFLTENQAKLLMKILKENSAKIPEFTESIDEALAEPTWSKNFRKIDHVKKFFIGKNQDSDFILVVEFTFSSELRKLLAGISKSLENFSASTNGKFNTADLTEKNLVILYEALEPHGFDIDESIKNHYKTIKSWTEQTIRDQFLIGNIEYKNFHQAITDDLGISTSIDQNIINDRSIRYQYFLENAKNHGENLVENIANRASSKIWISKEEHNLNEVIGSLVNLHRLPLLVVFDNVVSEKYYQNLKLLSDALENNGITDRIGIYFRLPSDSTGKQFNQFIADKEYNYNLDSSTQVAAVMSGKLPKFFLKSPWCPMSVLALDTKMGLRHGKISVYSNRCDLVIEWADAETLISKKIGLR
jgi:hypothetical protein